MAEAGLRADSERHHFMMYWDVEEYKDGRFVFCDEIADYTFYPYIGSLKELPGYKEDRTAYEDVRIFLVINETGKLVKVPCNIVEESRRIYIYEGNFNKFWKQMSEKICREIRRRENNNKIPQSAVNEKVNFALVENPARSASIGRNFTIEYAGREIDIETQRLISKRASALADNKIRFVYAKSDRYIHDKSCELVEKIKYWDFGATEELVPDRELCLHCKRKIYIRNAIKSDTKHFGWYQRFFEKGRAGSRVLENFLYGTDIKLHMDSIDELIVKCKEDTWKISMSSQGTYTLYHNNYVMLNEEERYITSGFHVQKHHPPYLPGILTYIQEYDWQKHLEAKNAPEPEPEAVIEIEEQKPEEKKSFVKKVMEVVKRIFTRS